MRSNIAWFDGNDALVLKNGSAIIDRLGRVGENPGTEWRGSGVGTKNVTLRRKFDICAGDTTSATRLIRPRSGTPILSIPLAIWVIT